MQAGKANTQNSPRRFAGSTEHRLLGDEDHFFIANGDNLTRSHFCPFSRVDRSIHSDPAFGNGRMGSTT